MSENIAASLRLVSGAGILLLSVAGGAATPSLRTDGRAAQVSPRFCDGLPRDAYKSGKHPTPRLLPRDEAASNPEFAQFLRRLLAAVARRDATAVLQVTAADFKLDFGGGDGIEFLRRALVSDTTDFWEEFPKAIALGGTFSETGFSAPYVYSSWPHEFDSYECSAIVGRGVRLRAQPNMDSTTLAVLDYDIIEEAEDRSPDPGWTHVRTSTGLAGYVASRYVRSPIDYRAWFTYTGGQWRLAAFIAGD